MSTMSGNGAMTSKLREQSRELPAWTVSLFVHTLLLFVFALTSVSRQRPRTPVRLDTRISEPQLDPAVNMIALDPGSDSQFAAENSALFMAPTIGDTEPELPQIEERLADLDVEVPEAFELPDVEDFSPTLHVGGTVGEHVGGMEGGIDRLTYEILQSLRQRKTVVAWVLDASGSLDPYRKQIAERLDRVYSELGALRQTRDDSLLSTVVHFGESVVFPLGDKPIADLEKIKRAIVELQHDPKGEEKVFTAVGSTAEMLLPWRRGRERRNVMIIVLTDEKGSDEARLEEAIDLTRRYGISVYVVGWPAVFGREKNYVPWTHDETGRVYQIDVDQGPESARLERLRLGFWGGAGENYDIMSSSFGTWALTRLTRETGGLYLIIDEGPGPSFDPLILREYRPDYVSRQEYDAMLQSNRAMAAVVAAAETAGATKVFHPRRLFAAPDDATLRRQLQEAQKPAALFDSRLQELLTILKAGARDREAIRSPRWQAAFDLAYGRVLAMRVRVFGYNAMLAQMKGGPERFTDEKNNHWSLKPSDQIATGAQVEQAATDADRYLRRVVKEHPDTPWAVLAQTELEQPLGWEWVETFRPIPKRDDSPSRPSMPRDDPPPVRHKPAPKPVLPKL